MEPTEELGIGEVLLRRSEAAAVLNAAGYPIVATTLATMASKGTGPKFRRFGRIPLYRKDDLLEWAEKRTSPLGHSVAECKRNAAA